MLNIGDFIEIKRGAPYTITQYNSTGIVTAASKRQVLVEFDYITGPPSPDGDMTFWIDIAHCKLTKQLSQQDRVCAKIKQMETRWLAFQEKRLQERKTCYV